MKNIYLAQFTYAQQETPYIYFPYSVGTIWAYAQTHRDICDNYTLAKFLMLTKPIDEIVNSLVDPYLIGFSIYVWNTEYSLQLAKAVKQRWPNCIIVFGGPNVPKNTDPSIEENTSVWLAQHSFIDYAVINEGEQAFASLLQHLLNDTDDVIPGLAYIKNGIYHHSPPARFLRLNELPSPYVLGLFDELMVEAKENNLILNGLLETNRGCPYQCTFCDWGTLTYQKVKQLELDRVYADISWFAKNEVELVTTADANFGIFVARDTQIIDYICQQNTATGWPKIFDGSWAKNLKPVHVEMIGKLYDQGLFRRFTASMQSFSPEVLKTIKRKNITLSQFHELLTLSAARGVPVSTELILGLPGETAESYKSGIAYCVEHSIVYYVSLLTNLQNSEMNDKQYRELHDIKSIEMVDPSGDSTDDTNDLVVSHTALTEQEYVDLVIWNQLVTCLYCYKTANHIISSLIEKGADCVVLLDKIVNKLRTHSVVADYMAQYANHVKDGTTYALSANGVNEADVYVITQLVSQTDEEQLAWWSLIDDNITLDDIVHQRLSVNRDYRNVVIKTKNRTYTSNAIPARYSSWQTWLITTRWNNNAERIVGEIND